MEAKKENGSVGNQFGTNSMNPDEHTNTSASLLKGNKEMYILTPAKQCCVNLYWTPI